MATIDVSKIQDKILGLLHSFNGEINQLSKIWDAFPDKDYDMTVFPALLKLEFTKKIRIDWNKDGGIIAIKLSK